MPGPSTVPAVTIVLVARLGEISGSALDLIATLVTVTVIPGNGESDLSSAGGTPALLASFGPDGGSTGVGQSLDTDKSDQGGGGGEPEAKKSQDDADGLATRDPSNAPADRLPAWARFAVGLEDAWEELRMRLNNAERGQLAPSAGQKGPIPGDPSVNSPTPSDKTPRLDQAPTETKPGSREGAQNTVPPRGHEPPRAANDQVQPGGLEQVLSLPDTALIDRAIEEVADEVRPGRETSMSRAELAAVASAMTVAWMAMGMGIRWRDITNDQSRCDQVGPTYPWRQSRDRMNVRGRRCIGPRSDPQCDRRPAIVR
jgi:hypothetical protein